MYASTLPRSNWLRRASIRLAWYRHMPGSSFISVCIAQSGTKSWIIIASIILICVFLRSPHLAYASSSLGLCDMLRVSTVYTIVILSLCLCKRLSHSAKWTVKLLAMQSTTIQSASARRLSTNVGVQLKLTVTPPPPWQHLRHWLYAFI